MIKLLVAISQIAIAKTEMFLIEHIFLPYFNKIFATLYKNQFFKMLEIVGNRRIIDVAEDDRIELKTTLLNEISIMKRFCNDGRLRR